MKVNVASIVSCYCYSTLLILGLSLPTIYFAYTEENDSCQKDTRVGMVLSDWLKVAGLTAVVYTVFIPTIVMVAELVDVDEILYAIPIVLLLDILFWIAWLIIGVIINSTNENRKCIEEGTGLGVMAILQLSLGVSRFAYFKMGIDLVYQ